MTRRLTIACLAVVSSCACPDTSPKEIAPSVDAALSPVPPSSRQLAWQQAKIDHARYIALADNRGAYLADLERKYPAIWKGLEIDTRMPDEPALDTLRAGLSAHTRKVGMKVRRIGLELAPPDIPEGHALPDVVGPDEAFTWAPGELVREVKVEVELSPIDLGKLESWFARRRGVGRLLIVDEVSLGKGRATVRATAFHFVREPKLPRRKLAAFVVDETDTKSEGALAQTGALHREINAQLPLIDEALGYRTQAQLWDARYALFERKTQQSAAQRWSDLIR